MVFVAQFLYRSSRGPSVRGYRHGYHWSGVAKDEKGGNLRRRPERSNGGVYRSCHNRRCHNIIVHVHFFARISCQIEILVDVSSVGVLVSFPYPCLNVRIFRCIQRYMPRRQTELYVKIDSRTGGSVLLRDGKTSKPFEDHDKSAHESLVSLCLRLPLQSLAYPPAAAAADLSPPVARSPLSQGRRTFRRQRGCHSLPSRKMVGDMVYDDLPKLFVLC